MLHTERLKNRQKAHRQLHTTNTAQLKVVMSFYILRLFTALMHDLRVTRKSKETTLATLQYGDQGYAIMRLPNT